MKAGQTADGMDQVDAISGATITSKGVETMILTSIQAFADKGFFEGVNSSTDETGETDEISEQSIKEEE